ncbi:Zinc finger, MYND-type [Niveomyces insectorum RCEF 264]|uniref:Zinc finger, MYND-type n=1 Tax=Niveomyces insectorum RCEF 264 TaxID=1081102 RepID=A0A167REX7_9HYPO|nr:Zinc finger, MYND-type [Niveomyces insectorum RCEF 264]
MSLSVFAEIEKPEDRRLSTKILMNWYMHKAVNGNDDDRLASVFMDEEARATVAPENAQPPVAGARCNYCASLDHLDFNCRCGEAVYCSPKCQRDDQKLHGPLCGHASRVQGTPNQAGNMHRAILLPTATEKPEFVWLTGDDLGRLSAAEVAKHLETPADELRLFLAERPRIEQHKLVDRFFKEVNALPDHMVVAIRGFRDRFTGPVNKAMQKLAGPGRLYPQHGAILLVAMTPADRSVLNDILAVDENKQEHDRVVGPDDAPPPEACEAPAAEKMPFIGQLRNISMYDWTVFVLNVLSDDMQVSIEDARVVFGGPAPRSALKVNCREDRFLYQIGEFERVFIATGGRSRFLCHNVSPYAVALGLPWVVRSAWRDLRLTVDMADDVDDTNDRYVGVLGSHRCLPQSDHEAHEDVVSQFDEWNSGLKNHSLRYLVARVIFQEHGASANDLLADFPRLLDAYDRDRVQLPDVGELQGFHHPFFPGTMYVYHRELDRVIQTAHLTAFNAFLQRCVSLERDAVVLNVHVFGRWHNNQHCLVEHLPARLKRHKFRMFFAHHVDQQGSPSHPYNPAGQGSHRLPGVGPCVETCHCAREMEDDLRTELKQLTFPC